MSKKGKLTKEESKIAEAAAMAVRLPSAKPQRKFRNHKHKVLGALPELKDLNLLPSSVEASAVLLQPDALLARGCGTSGNRFPGAGDPTATLVTRSFSPVSIAAGTQELWYILGMHTQINWVYSDMAAVPSAVPNTLFGSVLRMVTPIAEATVWPSFATLYTYSGESWYVMVVPWTAAQDATHSIMALEYTDGVDIWLDINQVDVNGKPLVAGQPRMKVRKTGGDLLMEAAPTLETSCIVSAFTTQTGASGAGHVPLTTGGIRAASRTFDYAVVNMQSPGFNVRYPGPTEVNNLYDPYHTNQTFEDADEDDVTSIVLDKTLTAFEADFVERLKACVKGVGTVDLSKFQPRLVTTGPDLTDSPPEVADTICGVYLHNSGSAIDAAVTCAFAYEFYPNIGGGYESRSVAPDPNWAIVLDVSHTKVPILVGPHSFGDFFSSLWSGVKDVAGEVWGGVKDAIKPIVSGAVQGIAKGAI